MNRMAVTRSRPHRWVLVVEDEQLMRRLLEKVISNQGTPVLLAADGEEAIEIYRRYKEEISVVLLDLGLPKISGSEVFKLMREENPYVRVVVASGYLEPEVKSKMRDAGVEHFIEKPYLLDKVIATLQSLMR